ncbi:GMC oxidoreductase [Laetiporus sulphureus 93-53]|uniref:GMC oxidoreductase n=1 Tax=Laetiporus sulphureus 93-53 TaxID=1314785 RepID=A0A165CRZ9_9APHY|nr:GMC oxidoreductase [Laetiporus sulphureus 93-53]KZT03334.1 GMC oxidoreductase [Laetiporus sulphureus 93-53]
MNQPVGLEVDIIVAGGGTSGCVLASRLAEEFPDLSILIVEAGPSTQDDVAHIQPARYRSHMRPDSTTMKFYASKESEYLDGRSVIVPTAQCLGGGSSVNWMMYARACVSDYDDWENVHGNKGWGYKDLLPFLRKMETYQIESGKETHGDSGPLKVSWGGYRGNLEGQFLDVAAKYDPERGSTDDVNAMTECNVYGRNPKWIDATNGRRQDVPHQYLYKLLNSTKLTVITEHVVKRVICRNERAVGIEYVSKHESGPGAKQQIHTVHARRLVVISAGAFGSPGILERSGIGGEKLLRDLSIDTIVDLPGVGENYNDHVGLFAPYVADDKADTHDALERNDPDEVDKWNAQWFEDGTGMMAANGLDAVIKLRPTMQELQDIGPDFHSRWAEAFEDATDRPVMWFGTGAWYGKEPVDVPSGKYWNVCYFLLRPSSIGYVHITSADNVHAPPDFDPKFLSCKDDLALLRWLYKRSREFARRLPYYRGEYLPGHPNFAPHSAAAGRASAQPVEISAPNLVFNEEDDKAIDDHTRASVSTIWHSLGTCAMKARNKGGVVDSQLNVYGVQGLKVADMSIAPANVASNTYSTALVIGEKAAQIIIKEIRSHIPLLHL